MTRGISWNWDEARRGVFCALPSPALLLGVDVSLGIVFALGTLPVALLGVPPRRAQRPRLPRAANQQSHAGWLASPHVQGSSSSRRLAIGHAPAVVFDTTV